MDKTTELSQLELYSNANMRMSVVEALDSLMKDTPIDRIPVSKICQVSGISRATFYRYFTDKFSIVQWYVCWIHSQGANEIGRSMSWYTGYYTSEAIISRHMDFFNNAAKSKDYNSLDSYAPRLRVAALQRTITEYHHREFSEHMKFMVEATVKAETAMFPACHNGEITCSLEEACRWMVECVPAELRELLDTPA